jgi:putative membrane protein insertion efficiency factor
MKYILIYIIKFYKNFISPMFPPSCRFYPTCSSYFIEALQRYGFFIGTFLGIKRILRCNPFFKGGFDPVPDKFQIIKFKKLDG